MQPYRLYAHASTMYLVSLCFSFLFCSSMLVIICTRQVVYTVLLVHI
jgi:hypothetical protein